MLKFCNLNRSCTSKYLFTLSQHIDYLKQLFQVILYPIVTVQITRGRLLMIIKLKTTNLPIPFPIQINYLGALSVY